MISPITVWLFFSLIGLGFGIGLIGFLPFPIPLGIEIFTMGIGSLCLHFLEKREKEDC